MALWGIGVWMPDYWGNIEIGYYPCPQEQADLEKIIKKIKVSKMDSDDEKFLAALSWEHFPKLLHIGLELERINLIWKAINFAMKDTKFIAQKDFSRDGLSAQTKKILTDLKELAKNNPSWQTINSIIAGEYSENLFILNHLNEILLGDLRALPDGIKLLWIEGSQVKNLSLNNLVELECLNCDFLENIEVESADRVYIEDCSSLLSVKTRNVKKIYIHDCSSVKILDVENAEEVTCPDNHALESLNVKNAKKDVNISGCCSIKILDTDAEDVEFEYCKSLTHIHLKNVREIICIDFPNLERINAESAERVDIQECPKLKYLHSNAKYIDCRDCALETIDAENAEEIQCSGSPVKVLNAINAKKVICIDCPEDIILNVPLTCLIIREEDELT